MVVKWRQERLPKDLFGFGLCRGFFSIGWQTSSSTSADRFLVAGFGGLLLAVLLAALLAALLAVSPTASPTALLALGISGSSFAKRREYRSGLQLSSLRSKALPFCSQYYALSQPMYIETRI